VFLIGPDNVLTELKQTTYESEDLLQRLLSDHPALLASSVSPNGRLLLIRREFGVPQEQGGADHLSLDHLFVDETGVPVLVEVKRAENTQIRRIVVAQMLDYAANGITYWPIDKLRAAFAQTTQSAGAEPADVLQAFLGDAEPESFWRQVESNLKAGRVRLIFVADRIPPELARVVEFLNEQMQQVDVLAVEVDQFLGKDGIRTLVPKLIGNTQRAQANKSIEASRPSISESELLAGLSADARAGADRLIAWLKQMKFQVGVIAAQKSITARIGTPDGRKPTIVSIDQSGKVWFGLGGLQYFSVFKDAAATSDVLNGIRAVPGLHLSAASQYPTFPVQDLARDEPWPGFSAVINDVVTKLLAG
jgi:hypothetical protein